LLYTFCFLAFLKNLLNFAFDFLYSIMLCVFNSMLSFPNFFILFFFFLNSDSLLFRQGTVRGWVDVEFYGMDR